MITFAFTAGREKWTHGWEDEFVDGQYRAWVDGAEVDTFTAEVPDLRTGRRLFKAAVAAAFPHATVTR